MKRIAFILSRIFLILSNFHNSKPNNPDKSNNKILFIIILMAKK